MRNLLARLILVDRLHLHDGSGERAVRVKARNAGYSQSMPLVGLWGGVADLELTSDAAPPFHALPEGGCEAFLVRDETARVAPEQVVAGQLEQIQRLAAGIQGAVS